MIKYIKRFIRALLVHAVVFTVIAIGYVLVMSVYLLRQIKLIPFLHNTFVIVVKLMWIDAKIYVDTGKKGNSLQHLQEGFKNLNSKLKTKITEIKFDK